MEPAPVEPAPAQELCAAALAVQGSPAYPGATAIGRERSGGIFSGLTTAKLAPNRCVRVNLPRPGRRCNPLAKKPIIGCRRGENPVYKGPSG